MSSSEPSPPSPAPPSDRREFLKAAACATLGGCALLPALGAATVVLARPLSAKGVPVPVRLTNLTALPLNGPPKAFQVVTERFDAWTKFPANAIGSVFLRRVGERDVIAFNAACPHLGCAVEFQKPRDAFYCPCHDSEFAKDGAVRGQSPSRRGLDTLEVEVNEDGDVWVKFRQFKTGIGEKIPVA